MPQDIDINYHNSGQLPLGASLFTIFLCSLFGANAVAIKISLTGLGTFTTLALRFSIAAVVLTLWARWQKIPLALHPKQFAQISLVSLLFFLQMSGIYTGQNLTTASHGTLIANLLPFIVMILAHFFLENDRINMKKMGGLVLGFSGVSLLFFDSAHDADSSILGDCIIFSAIVIWGCNVVIIKRIIAAYTPVQITLFPMLFSIPLFLGAALLFDNSMIGDPSPDVLFALLYQAIVTASFGFIMWNTLVRKYGATALHSFIFIVPVSGVFCGVTILGEPMSARLIWAICLVCTGLVSINLRLVKRS